MQVTHVPEKAKSEQRVSREIRTHKIEAQTWLKQDYGPQSHNNNLYKGGNQSRFST